jgi:predicted enzyme related to lactoylglutathione lyase
MRRRRPKLLLTETDAAAMQDQPPGRRNAMIHALRIVALATALALSGPAAATEPGSGTYVEFDVRDIARAKAFYQAAFGWSFTDYGADYTSFVTDDIAGGFARSDAPAPGGPLLVFHVVDLAAAEARIRAAGGTIVRPAFAYPGGRRFHFRDPDGYEVAVWSER